MKKLIISIVILSISNGIFSQTDIYTDVIKYNDYIIDIVVPLDDAYSKIMEEEDEMKSKKLVKNFAKLTKSSLSKLKALKSYKNDATFKDAAVSYVGHLDRISHHEVPEFMKIIFGPDILSEKNQKRLDELIIILADQRIAFFDQVVEVQKTFAKKFDYTIVGE